MIAARDIVYQHPGSTFSIWNNGLSFDLGDSRMSLLLGPSGSGKSTLARLLCSLLPGAHGGKLGGELLVGGRPVSPHPDGRVAMLFQNVEAMLHSPRVGDELAERARAARCAGALSEAVELLEIGPLLTRTIRELSGGEKQRVALAAAVTGGPDLLVLDEPTGNLDEAGAAAMTELLSRIVKRGCTALLAIEHRPHSLVPLSDGVMRINGADGVRPWRGPKGAAPCEVIGARIDLDGVRQQADASRHAAPASQPLLECQHLSCRRVGRPVLKDLRLEIGTSQIVGLCGPNGSGKTTLLEGLIGAVRCSRSSRVRWRGRHKRRAVPVGSVGMLVQNPLHQLFCETVRSEIAMAAENAKLEGIDRRVRGLLTAADLIGVAERATLALSFGQQQRTALAAAMSHDPELVLLDEPTHGMDDVHLRGLVEMILERRTSGTAFVIASHDRKLLEACCDRILRLEQGVLHEN